MGGAFILRAGKDQRTVEKRLHAEAEAGIKIGLSDLRSKTYIIVNRDEETRAKAQETLAYLRDRYPEEEGKDPELLVIGEIWMHS